jgi:hypothetical protein
MASLLEASTVSTYYPTAHFKTKATSIAANADNALRSSKLEKYDKGPLRRSLFNKS